MDKCRRIVLKQVKLLGIFGGTFDPIHYGHLIAAQYASDEFNLDKVLIVPTARPPHKEIENVEDELHRYNMVLLAVQDNPVFEVSTLEMDRKGYSYTVDTIAYCCEKHPESQLFLIIGADCLLQMYTWKDVESLVTMCNFIVVTRPGYAIKPSDKALTRLPAAIWDRLKYLEVPGFDISSSTIRERVARGKTIKYLVPPEVENYIFEKGLYRQEEKADD